MANSMSFDNLCKILSEKHPDRFVGNVHVDPNDIMGAVRRIEQLRESDNALNEDVEKLQRLLQG